MPIRGNAAALVNQFHSISHVPRDERDESEPAVVPPTTVASEAACPPRSPRTYGTKPQRVALVLFVKNECEDILWWISWHLSTGIDTIVIYDDYSVDGTWELINEAAKVYDVRPRRAVQTLLFNQRQALTYMHALNELRDEFDWLLYLDADEYLDVTNGEDVHIFLSRFPEDVSGIAVNWRCYGSNRQVEKPPTPNVFENYQGHSEVDFELNHLVKSFFRPKKTESIYINPHRFAIDGKYVRPSGKDFEWQTKHPERTVELPEWSRAAIRHYIIRSVEHFVEKSKRRSDIRSAKIGIGLFNAYDRNENLDILSLRRVGALYPFLYAFQNRCNTSCLSEFSEWPSKENTMTSVPENELALAQLQNSHLSPVLPVVFSEYRIVAHRESGRLIHVGEEKINDADITPVTFFQLKNFPDHVFLTALEQFVPLHAVGDPRVSTILAYERIEVDHGKFALRQPFTKKIFCIGAPNEQDRTGIIECNRDWVGAWEHLEWVIDPAQPPVCDPLLEHIVRAMTSTRPLDERGLDLSTPRRTDALLAALTCSMTSEEAVEGAKKQILNLPWHKQETFLSL